MKIAKYDSARSALLISFLLAALILLAMWLVFLSVFYVGEKSIFAAISAWKIIVLLAAGAASGWAALQFAAARAVLCGGVGGLFRRLDFADKCLGRQHFISVRFFNQRGDAFVHSSAENLGD
jgi:hypothetical protein